MEDLEITKIATELTKDPSVVENWKQFYNALELHWMGAVILNKFHNLGRISTYEVFEDILENWKSINEEQATTQNVEIVLQNLGFVNVADKISCMNTITSYDYRSIKFPLHHNFEELVAKYVARPSLEDEVITGLRNYENRHCPINFPIVIIHGICGTGKTSIARRIFQLAKEHEENCIWLNAETEELIIQDLAQLIGISSKIRKTVFQATLKNFYSSNFKNRQCLIVFDNVTSYEKLLEYLPLNIETKISALITSNIAWDSRNFGKVNIVDIKNFTNKEFAEFAKITISNVSKFEIQGLQSYTEKIPYLANIVCLGFAKWKKLQPDVDIDEYFNFIETIKSISNAKLPEEIVENEMHMMKQFEGLDGAAAHKLLSVLAYSKPEIIKSRLIGLFKIHTGFKITGKSDELAEKVISILTEHGFVEQKSTYLSIHPCYQTAIQNILQGHGKEAEEISQLLPMIEDFKDTLNCSLLLKFGKNYGDSMLESIVKNPASFQFLLEEDFSTLVEYFKRTKSKAGYAQLVLFGDPELEFQPLLCEANRKYAQLIIDDFGDLVKEMRLYRGQDKKYILSDLAQWVAFEKKVWMDALFEHFSRLLPPFMAEGEESLLHIAAGQGELTAVEYFIEKGADVNGRDAAGWTPLHHSAHAGSLKVLELLLSRGANPNMREKCDGDTPLIVAARKNNADVGEILVANKADPKLQNNKGETALDWANDWSNIKFIGLLQK